MGLWECLAPIVKEHLHEILAKIYIMNTKILLIFVFVIVSQIVNGQNKIQGYILDKQTLKPLSYATIGALNQQYGTYTDTSGLFTLYFLNITDSLKVSYLGYKSIHVCVQDLQRSTTILIESDPLQLNEVVIKPQKTKKRKLETGYFSDKSKGFLLPHFPLNMNATFIPFPKECEDVIIKSIRFKYKLEGINSPLRIRILKVLDNGEPGDDVVYENIIFKDYKQTGKQIAIVDVSKYNVIMPRNGIFIALEWIDRTPEKTDKYLGVHGPAIGTIRAIGPSDSKWINSYNHPKWRETSLPWTYAIGLSGVNYSER